MRLLANTQNEASRWSAQRLLAEFPEFSNGPGEGFRWCPDPVYWRDDLSVDVDQHPQLQSRSAQIAAKAGLADALRRWRLKQNRVRSRRRCTTNDMYVHREFSEETAALVPNIKLWVTSEYEHNGLRADGEAILDRLPRMVRNQ